MKSYIPFGQAGFEKPVVFKEEILQLTVRKAIQA
jgi:hypothetical protein